MSYYIKHKPGKGVEISKEDAATQLGATLGVFVRYGRDNVVAAVAALADGRATAAQQRIAHQLLLAVAGR